MKSNVKMPAGFPVKVCGLTRGEDAQLALKLGAWALGFVFYQKSPRYIAPRAVRSLLEDLRRQFSQPFKAVGVVVNETAVGIQEIVQESGVDTIQLHGDETLAIFQEIRSHLKIELIKAFRPQSLADLRDAANFQEAQYYLLDAAVPGIYGGSGQVADWSFARHLKKLKPLILSGGLRTENVVTAIREVQPAAIDLSSGLEERPGIKSHQKLQELFRQLEDQL